ncbi:MAG: DotA/TraY family protein [Candidatus Comchoanobacterales bacterium]
MRRSHLFVKGLLLSMMCCAGIVYAGDDARGIFTPAASDLSLKYLRMIFGSVGNALTGTDNLLVGKLFEIFNIGVLSIVGALIGYSVIMAAVSTSQDAQQAFQNKVSPWAVFRVAIGSGLLIPTFNGYSGIQVLVMTVVVQGVGFANYIWSHALGAMGDNGVQMAQVITNNDQDSILDHNRIGYLNEVIGDTKNNKNKELIRYLIESNMCNIAMSDLYQQWRNDHPDCTISSSANQAFTIYGSEDSNNYFQSSSVNYGAKEAAKLFGDKSSDKSCQSDSFYGSYHSNNLPTGVKIEWDTICGSLNTSPNLQNKENVDVQTIYQELDHQIYSQLMSLRMSDQYYQPTENIINQALDLLILKSPEDEKINADKLKKNPWKKNAKDDGWVMAGMHYKDLVTSSSDKSDASSDTLIADGKYRPSIVNRQENGTLITDTDSIEVSIAKKWEQWTNYLKDKGGFDKQYNNIKVNISKEYNDVKKTMTSVGTQQSQQNKGLQKKGDNLLKAVQKIHKAELLYSSINQDAKNRNFAVANFKAAMDGSLSQLLGVKNLTDADLSGYTGLVSSFSSPSGRFDGDPVTAFGKLGQTFITESATYWSDTINTYFSELSGLAWMTFGISTAAATTGAVIEAVGSGFPGGEAVGKVTAAATTSIGQSLAQLNFELQKALMTLFLPLGSALVTILFGCGILLGVYLPFLPYLLFLFGVIGWIIAVIEAMVAAPLVAMGVTHPEGHDLLGKGEQALILLLGVFVRPATMILGLFFAIMLANISVRLVNIAFVYTMTDFLNMSFGDSVPSGDSNVLAAYVMLLGIIMVYTYVILALLNRVYSLIYLIPDRILRWIGGQPDQSATAQMMGKMQQQISGAGGQIAGGASGATQSMNVQAPAAGSMDFKKDKGKLE